MGGPKKGIIKIKTLRTKVTPLTMVRVKSFGSKAGGAGVTT